ncbi:MAG TPA: hypothetical protein VG738_04300 [Chitinophagaceae bacterium]|nr:hypothetical protein [Chitinophagaceae bacterium]
MIIILGAVVAYGIIYSIIVITKKDSTVKKAPAGDAAASMQMQLQAYERLLLLVDRIALPNLISRLGKQNTSAKEMQHLLTQSIREEFDYNITQQIYVSTDAWTAVKNLKEQNMLIVNQLANALPANATGLDLNKLLLQFLMNDKKGTLHEMVSDALSYEAKKVLSPGE